MNDAVFVYLSGEKVVEFATTIAAIILAIRAVWFA
jgi:hypothetical protein